MKIILLAVLVSLISFSFRSTDPRSSSTLNHFATDTARINHTLDGWVNEWPENKFESDNGTTIRYAVDNDAKNLYIAMKVPSAPTQMKMMGQGMEVYIDLKGKKKDNK